LAEVRRAVRELVLADVEVEGRRVDVHVRGGRVTAVGGRAAGVEVLDGRGGALLPALNDHHLHLLAAAADARSVACGPPAVSDVAGLRAALAAAAGTWVRGTGYHESVAGRLDRALLDELAPDRPVRVQHRTGGQWVLNSRGLAELAAGDVADGVLWRGDPRLAARATQEQDWPDLAALGHELAELGVLGVCDATPDQPVAAVEQLVRAGLPQQVLALGAPDDWEDGTGAVQRGPRKILLGDEDDLDWDRLLGKVLGARAAGRAVAVHTVTRASLLLALSVLQEVGVAAGDRLEHAAVVPPDVVPVIARLGVGVVTQPALAARRGDDYLRDVDPRDRADLWPYASLLAAGVRVAAASDAPYGPLDPWEVLRQARDRRTPGGTVLEPDERVPVRVALDGLLSPLERPGGAPRRVEPGASADLVLLHAPLAQALQAPSRDLVRLVCATR
jgi:predicted amidohydrolase YtcJ